MRYIKILLVLSIFIITSCATTVVRQPTVHSRGAFTPHRDSQFYIIGETVFGIPDIIADVLRENRFDVQTISDIRDIPANPRAERITQYIITTEYDLVSDNGMWLLDIRIFEFNPRGTNNQIALGTTTSSASTRTMVRAVMTRLIVMPF